MNFAKLTVRIARTLVGLGLVLAAFSSNAFAVPPSTPEIDPGSLGSAVALLSGAVMLLKGRGRRHSK